MKSSDTILLTGATGYIGGRLLKRLAGTDSQIRCLARRPQYLRERVPQQVEIVKGDALDANSLTEAMKGIKAAYYLIHSMGSRGSFETDEKHAAENFAAAARQCGVERIVFLGGLGDESRQLSAHLRSRHLTGKILRTSGVPVIELRASIVIGAGSISFEMIRSLVEKLPAMTTPHWVHVEAQPIAISDLLDYLEKALEIPLEESGVFEIGGSDVVSYAQLMKEYARQRGLKRYILPVRLLTPRLSSLWLGLVTPLYARTGRKLIDSLKYPTIVNDRSAGRVFGLTPVGVAAAIAQALSTEEHDLQQTRWSDSLAAGDTLKHWEGRHFGRRLIDSRARHVRASQEDVFQSVSAIGGKRGWHYANWLWRLRGFLDLLMGGVGMRRGRRHPTQLLTGDVVDCWRVESLTPASRLRLVAEMHLPGRAWLEFETKEVSGGTSLRQTATFDPLGLPGLLYWYSIYPLHAMVFNGMLRGIAGEAEKRASSRPQ